MLLQLFAYADAGTSLPRPGYVNYHVVIVMLTPEKWIGQPLSAFRRHYTRTLFKKIKASVSFK